MTDWENSDIMIFGSEKMDFIEKNAKKAMQFVFMFLKWVLISVFTGLIGGAVGTAFHKSIELATEFRGANPYVLYFLPVSGLVIVFMYKLCRVSHKLGTNDVLSTVRDEKSVPAVMAPLIFISTVLTHLCGGSAGREGAALQLGGSIGAFAGRIFKLNEKDMPLIVMCGMSGVFSALFGTPLTASFFAIEVVSVGIMYYSALVPCLTSALTAYGVSVFFGVEPVRFSLSVIPSLEPLMLLKTALAGVIFAVFSIVFCLVMHGTAKLYSKYLKNLYARAFVGGIIVIILTFLVGSYDYNGAGMNIVEKAIDGNARPEAFILKLIFTAVTIGAGFKGGEIVPTFFAGSTLGCVLGGLIGIPPSFCAALGLTALFCGVVNCPVASVFLAIELFGGQGIVYYAVTVVISYMLSGYFGLYSSQKIVYSKLKAEYINIHAK